MDIDQKRGGRGQIFQPMRSKDLLPCPIINKKCRPNPGGLTGRNIKIFVFHPVSEKY
jgi:hypothetical protein